MVQEFANRLKIQEKTLSWWQKRMVIVLMGLL